MSRTRFVRPSRRTLAWKRLASNLMSVEEPGLGGDHAVDGTDLALPHPEQAWAISVSRSVGMLLLGQAQERRCRLRAPAP